MFSTCCAAWLRPPWPFQPLALLPTHSLVFWFGDLNFRIESLDIRFVKYAIDSNILSQLWEKDQVRALGDTVEPLLGPEWHLALAKLPVQLWDRARPLAAHGAQRALALWGRGGTVPGWFSWELGTHFLYWCARKSWGNWVYELAARMAWTNPESCVGLPAMGQG